MSAWEDALRRWISNHPHSKARRWSGVGGAALLPSAMRADGSTFRRGRPLAEMEMLECDMFAAAYWGSKKSKINSVLYKSREEKWCGCRVVLFNFCLPLFGGETPVSKVVLCGNPDAKGFFGGRDPQKEMDQKTNLSLATVPPATLSVTATERAPSEYFCSTSRWIGKISLICGMLSFGWTIESASEGISSVNFHAEMALEDHMVGKTGSAACSNTEVFGHLARGIMKNKYARTGQKASPTFGQAAWYIISQMRTQHPAKQHSGGIDLANNSRVTGQKVEKQSGITKG
ncbi:hypothetical protein K438DRAFT_1762466 [Mycena galopus ATCC 62051]|nr:hypothetical protein K438DRAFT_1762466 [Mycena galopus ATCC 62051]